jgi:3',5'-cyclic AMP phosphodiesterase CpdA
MRIFATADLHDDVKRSREPNDRLCEELDAAQPTSEDILVLAGDLAGAQIARLGECLARFAGFPGRKFLVPGNHDIWLPAEATAPDASLQRYRRELPDRAGDAGFGVLDHEPTVVKGTGLVGTIGWYDYAFRDTSLGIPLPFYERKIAPGAAEYYGGYEDILTDHAAELAERHLGIGARWMDGWRVRLGMNDVAFLEMLLERLADQLALLAGQCQRIAAFIHHVPFADLLPPPRRDRPLPDRFRFALAYMGSPRIGEVLSACPAVRWVVCGHSHWPTRRQIGKIEAINIGSTYIHKRLEVIDVD